MSAKHTPGPWYLRTNRHPNTDGTKWGWLDTNQAGDQRPPSGVNVTWSARQTSEANARLIAAAPELLEALEAVVSQLEGHDLHNGDVSAINTAYAAIAKATGEQELPPQPPPTSPNSSPSACPCCTPSTLTQCRSRWPCMTLRPDAKRQLLNF